ncbi:MAG: YkgJ family cysteine cluster protein [Bryobacteraceae bacterium]|nr:YkgJ family cysteine cluster protein [Bryobacteraceae bacterium]
MRREPDLIAVAGAAFEEARRRANGGIVCKPGCDSCCRRPFAITQADSERLRAAATPAIVARAREAWYRLAPDFPGDAATGELTANEPWREWFFERHSGLACPALDEASGECLVYEHRPIACRLYGPLIEIGGVRTDPCPLCYPDGVYPDAVRIDLPPAPPPPPETIIAWAFASMSGPAPYPREKSSASK